MTIDIRRDRKRTSEANRIIAKRIPRKRADDFKRATDIALASCGLAVLAAPMALIALAVWLEDRRSPFYSGIRMGLRLRELRMHKFRTMVPDAASSGVNSTGRDDLRITRVGKVLRRFKLDELPQLWNVLTGSMSLVGPRPQVPCDAALYTIEECRLLDVRPGITDLASIVFADEGEILAGSANPDLLYNQIIRPWKSRLALAYLDHASLGLDFRILALTLVSAVSRQRALEGVDRLLDAWNADPMLRRAALRQAPLVPWPPPGSTEIVTHYPRREAAKV
jgi:lipopolysaccharide/colanic/teichoic acid biosynthesis glycosyltransferase